MSSKHCATTDRPPGKAVPPSRLATASPERQQWRSEQERRRSTGTHEYFADRRLRVEAQESTSAPERRNDHSRTVDPGRSAPLSGGPGERWADIRRTAGVLQWDLKLLHVFLQSSCAFGAGGMTTGSVVTPRR